MSNLTYLEGQRIAAPSKANRKRRERIALRAAREHLSRRDPGAVRDAVDVLAGYLGGEPVARVRHVRPDLDEARCAHHLDPSFVEGRARLYEQAAEVAEAFAHRWTP